MTLTKFIIVGFIFLVVASTGCLETTSCVPVTPTAKYPIHGSDWGNLVIGEKL